MSTMPPFAPQYLFPEEYSAYGLPDNTQQPDIDSLVLWASTTIDETCGRTDGDGSGSLVYTTYQERLMTQSPGRNLYFIPQRPLVGLDASVVADLSASGAAVASGALTQPYYTGFMPSVNQLNPGPYGTAALSAIISASGRYAFPRRDTYPLTNDPYTFTNPLTILTLFGGPPPWIAIDMANLDYDPKTGELWLASGMWLEKYTEIIVIYNSGYHPRRMPRQIKMACAAIVKNMMAKGSGTTGMRSFSLGRSGISAQMDPSIVDPDIMRLLYAFMTTRQY